MIPLDGIILNTTLTKTSIKNNYKLIFAVITKESLYSRIFFPKRGWFVPWSWDHNGISTTGVVHNPN